VHFDAVFNRQKLWYADFTVHSSLAKRSLQKHCKNYPKLRGQTSGGGHTIAPEYATMLRYENGYEKTTATVQHLPASRLPPLPNNEITAVQALGSKKHFPAFVIQQT